MPSRPRDAIQSALQSPLFQVGMLAEPRGGCSGSQSGVPGTLGASSNVCVNVVLNVYTVHKTVFH